MKKTFFSFLLLSLQYSFFTQTSTPYSNSTTNSQTFIPFSANNYVLAYSDEFNGTMNPEWVPLDPVQPWGIQTFSSNNKYLTFSSIYPRQFLELKAYVDYDGGVLKDISAGIAIPDKVWNGTSSVINPDNPLYYGYYEIEARITKGTQKLDNIGLWPAFWFFDSGYDSLTSKYWVEEVDIFEPGACQVKDDYTAFHYWTLNDDSQPGSPANRWLDPEHECLFYNVDMFNWHRWGVEWLPDRLTYYYDGIPVHTIRKKVPSHDKPKLYLDLEVDASCTNPTNQSNFFIGSFQINYFRYYTPATCSGVIDEIHGDGYNFTSWDNSINNVKVYCIFKNTSIPTGSTTIIRTSDYVELKENFTVPYGSTLEINPTHCQ